MQKIGYAFLSVYDGRLDDVGDTIIGVSGTHKTKKNKNLMDQFVNLFIHP